MGDTEVGDLDGFAVCCPEEIGRLDIAMDYSLVMDCVFLEGLGSVFGGRRACAFFVGRVNLLPTVFETQKDLSERPSGLLHCHQRSLVHFVLPYDLPSFHEL